MNTGNEAIESKNGLLTTIAASTDSKVEYALEEVFLSQEQQFNGLEMNLC